MHRGLNGQMDGSPDVSTPQSLHQIAQGTGTPPASGRLASYRSILSQTSLVNATTPSTKYEEEPARPEQSRDLVLACLLAISPVTRDEAGDAVESAQVCLLACYTVSSHGSSSNVCCA